METQTLSTLVDSSPFWSSFFSQLLSTLIIVIVGSFIAPKILWWTRRSRLKFFRTNTRGSKCFELTESQDKRWETTINLSIFNGGSKTIDRFYWEVYTENDTPFEIAQTEPFPNEHKFNRQKGKKYTRWYGLIEMPIFPWDDIDFPFEFKIKFDTRKKVRFFYYFRTDTNNSPVRSRFVIYIGKIEWLRSLVVS